MLEPPCYGSVWPVVWGAGVKISRLPDSAYLGAGILVPNSLFVFS